jgi:hypothetical protein
MGTISCSIDATVQLRLDPKTGILYGSTNADNTPEFSILLSGITGRFRFVMCDQTSTGNPPANNQH